MTVETELEKKEDEDKISESMSHKPTSSKDAKDAKDAKDDHEWELKSKRHKYLIFSLNSEKYGVPLSSIKELIGHPEITPVPNSPSFFKGIFNLRGTIISVIDLRLKMGMEEIQYQNLKTSIVIIDIDSLTIGIVVDEVNEVAGFVESEIDENICISSKINKDLITSVAKKEGEKLVIILDVRKIFNSEELTNLKRMAGR